MMNKSKVTTRTPTISPIVRAVDHLIGSGMTTGYGAIAEALQDIELRLVKVESWQEREQGKSTVTEIACKSIDSDGQNVAHLGGAVYAVFCPSGDVSLRLNSHQNTDGEIILNPEVLANLFRFTTVKKLKDSSEIA